MNPPSRSTFSTENKKTLQFVLAIVEFLISHDIHGTIIMKLTRLWDNPILAEAATELRVDPFRRQ
jgi:hypothetical protein